ncbi:MAG TPA: CapA family protein [Candidatus Acidoferrales bacterium]|nr:CapA family protein [Candidatus Acidoferrales bacterium]
MPVTNFRNPWESTDAAEVAAVLAGSSARYVALELVGSESEDILKAIGVPTAPVAGRLIRAPDPASLRADLASHPKRLGFLAVADVDPSVRALAWGGVSLFGVGRVATLADWPLSASGGGLSGPVAAGPAYDPAAAWTLVAAGDINLDGIVAYRVKQQGKGVDFPFDGGTATITGKTCCSFAGNPLPIAKRMGDPGAVRALVSGADVALGNFENPAPDDFTYHLGGYQFTADPALIEGVRNAGFDWVSLANNHILNAGGAGLLQTIGHLDAWGIAHSGAGANLTAARQPALLRAGGLTIAILGYDTIRPDYAAGTNTPGTNEMTKARVTADVAAARAAGADFVVVFPHWGTEYTARTTAKQRALAHAAIDAGADLVIGSHPHWAGAVEVYKGVPIFYCLGDFVFSIDRSEQTLEGILPELTFVGTRLVQVRIHPYLILDLAQPNLLDPAGSGAVVMRQVFGASDRLPW